MGRCPIELTNYMEAGKKTYQCDRQSLSSDPEQRCILHSTYDKNNEEFIQELKRFIDWSNANNLPISCQEFVFPISDLNILFKNSKKLLFEGASFLSPLDLSGRTFKQSTSFRRAKFFQEVKFDQSTFNQDVTFEGSEFRDKASFVNTTFGSGLNLDKSTFSTEADFKTVKISRGSFQKVSFLGAVNFSSGNFSEDTNFHGTHFRKLTDFSEAQFTGTVSFYRSQFHQEVDFLLAIFGGSTDMSRAVFEGDANLRASRFESRLICRRAKFSKIDFSNAQFLSNLTFHFSKFLETANFMGAEFGGVVDISGALFSGNLVMDNTAIPESQRLVFSRHQCKGMLSLRSCRIIGQIIFDHSSKSEEKKKDALHENAPWGIDLTAAYIVKPGGIIFQGWGAPNDPLGRINVSGVYFALSNVQNIRFVNVKWDNPPAWRNFMGRRFKPNSRIARVADEDRIQILPGTRTCHDTVPREKQVSTIQVADVYKGLRQNYENNLQYTEAGIFHIREMEMRRIAEGSAYQEKASHHEKPTIKWLYLLIRAWQKRNISFLNYYRITSNYGEQYIRAFWTVIIWFLGLAWFERVLKPHIAPEPLGEFHETINYAITLVPGQIAGDNFTEFIARSVGIILIAVFVISLRRSFRR